jgi:hypothetical protein
MTGRAWEEEAVELDPVFIVGDLRSGTSILYRSIQSHPSFLPSTGLNVVESNAMELLLGLLGPADAKPSPLSHFAMGVEALVDVGRDVSPFRARRKVVHAIARGRIHRLGVWKAAGEQHVVRRYFLEAHRRRGARRLVEKTPRHLPWVPHLGTAFSRARFVFIMRHPLDALSSWWRRSAADPEFSSWANIGVDQFIHHWMRSIRLATSMAERDPRLLLIRYEDFTKDTEATVRRVLDHVAEPFDEACLLRGPAVDIPEALRGVPQVEAVRKADPLLFGSPIENSKRWADQIDSHTAARVEASLKDVMALVGYAQASAD